MGGGSKAYHRGYAERGDRNRAEGDDTTGHRSPRPFRADGPTSIAEAACSAACDDAGEAAGATDSATGVMIPPPSTLQPPPPPPGTENPQVDKGPPDNELLQPGRMRSRTRACHLTITTAGPSDHALFKQRPPNKPISALPTCNESELSKPPTYPEAIRSEYRANWTHATVREISGLEEARTFGDTYQSRGGTRPRQSGCLRESRMRTVRS